jgi:hypothetical protein
MEVLEGLGCRDGGQSICYTLVFLSRCKGLAAYATRENALLRLLQPWCRRLGVIEQVNSG